MLKSILEKIDKEPKIIFMIGGVGAGKNYTADKYFKGVKIIDPDDHTLELAKGDYNLQRNFIKEAIKWVNDETSKAVKNKETVIVTGTGANYKGYVNKVNKVLDAGMKVELIFVDTDPKQAFKNNQDRINKGGRGSTIPDYKFETSYDKAKYTYENICKMNICDCRVIKNKR